MEYPLKREMLAPGLHFSVLQDKKFKHNRIAIYLAVKLDAETASDNAVVPYILRQGTALCPDFSQLNCRLAQLYGASLDASVARFAEYQIITLGISVLDDRYALEGEDLSRQAASLLCEVLLHPNLVDGAFPEEETQLEKRFILDSIDAQINDKRTWAIARCEGLLWGDHPCAVRKYGSRAQAEKITPQSAAAAYERLLRQAQIEVMYLGCGDPEPVRQVLAEEFAQAFAGRERCPQAVAPSCARDQQGPVKTGEDRMEVTQGKLVLGFRVEGCRSYAEMNAVRMAAALLGGTATSLLFTNVREKLSLCYYCSSHYDRNTGVMYISSGIEEKNAQKAQEAILQQVQSLQNGDFADSDIQETALYLTTALRATGDSLGAMESWYLNQILGGTQVSPEEEIALCAGVDRAAVLAAAAHMKLDAVYNLRPLEGGNADE